MFLLQHKFDSYRTMPEHQFKFDESPYTRTVRMLV